MMRRYVIRELLCLLLVLGPWWFAAFYLLEKAMMGEGDWPQYAIIGYIGVVAGNLIRLWIRQAPDKRESPYGIAAASLFFLVFFPAVTAFDQGHVGYGVSASVALLTGIHLYLFVKSRLLATDRRPGTGGDE